MTFTAYVVFKGFRTEPNKILEIKMQKLILGQVSCNAHDFRLPPREYMRMCSGSGNIFLGHPISPICKGQECKKLTLLTA